MEMIRKIIALCVVMFALSTVFGGFANMQDETFTIVHTSIQDCEEEVEVIVHQNPKDCSECEGFKAREFADPQKVQPHTILRPVKVVEVEEEHKIEVVHVSQNVKFGEIYCDKCDDEVKTREFSEPTSRKADTVVMKIKQFWYDCWN